LKNPLSEYKDKIIDISIESLQSTDHITRILSYQIIFELLMHSNLLNEKDVRFHSFH